MARRLRELGRTAIAHEGDCATLVEAWAGVEHAVVVDAAMSGAAPGTLHRFDARARPLPARALRSSTHGFGVADAVELARALDRLPPRLDVYAVEAADVGPGAGLTPAVARAVEELTRALADPPPG